VPHPNVVSQHGNVIAADFRQSIELRIKSEVLYLDHAVCLIRVTILFDGKPIGIEHITLPLS